VEQPSGAKQRREEGQDALVITILLPELMILEVISYFRRVATVSLHTLTGIWGRISK